MHSGGGTDSHSTGGSSSERYSLLSIIGKGTFGDVYKAIDNTTNKLVAVKVVDLDDIGDDIQEIQQEISILRTCRSPNIVEFYSSWISPGSSTLSIAMELMAASTAELVSPDTNGRPLSEPSIAYILREVLNALVYLHSEHRIHRDIKAANILLTDQGMVKVSDFGVAVQLESTVASKRRTFVGSPLWMAPEVIKQSPDLQACDYNSNDSMSGGITGDDNSDNKDNTTTTTTTHTTVHGYDEAVDIWSLGITAIELALGEPPRTNMPSFRLLFVIVKDPPPQLEGSNFSTEFKDFVWQCLRKDPRDRPSAIDLLMHPFVVGAEPSDELVERIEEYIVKEREKMSSGGGIGGGGGVKSHGGGGGHDDSNNDNDGWDFGTVVAKNNTNSNSSNTNNNITTTNTTKIPPALEIPHGPMDEPPLRSVQASSRVPVQFIDNEYNNDMNTITNTINANAVSDRDTTTANTNNTTNNTTVGMMAMMGRQSHSKTTTTTNNNNTVYSIENANILAEMIQSMKLDTTMNNNNDTIKVVDDLGPLGDYLVAAWKHERSSTMNR